MMIITDKNGIRRFAVNRVEPTYAKIDYAKVDYAEIDRIEIPKKKTLFERIFKREL